MKIQRHKLAVLGLAVGSMLVLAGCTGNTSAAGDQVALDAEQEINLWGWSGAPGVDNIQRVIDAFEELHPNITVNYTEVLNTDYKNKASLALGAGEPIDVIGVQANAWATENQNFFLPVSDWPDSEGITDAYEPAVLAQEDKLFSDGVLRSVPFGSSGSAVGYYNVDLLKAAGLTDYPRTWDDFEKLTAGLKAVDPEAVAAVMPADTWFQDEFVLTLAGQIDPEFFNRVRYDGGSWDDPAYVQALERYKSLYDDGILDSTTLDLGYTDAMALFDQGKAAVVFNGTWEAGRLTPAFRETNKVVPSDVGVMPVPTFDASEDGSLRSFLDLTYGIPTASTHQAAAVEFIKFATAGDGVAQWATGFAFVPAVKGFAQPEGVLTTDVETDGYATLQSLVANPHGDRNNLSNLSAQVGTYILSVVNGTMTAQEAATQGQADLESGKYN